MNSQTKVSAEINDGDDRCIFCDSTEGLDVMYCACGAEPKVKLFKKNKRGKKENNLNYDLVKIKTGLSIWKLVLCSLCKIKLYGESIVRDIRFYKKGAFFSFIVTLSAPAYALLCLYIIGPSSPPKFERTMFSILGAVIFLVALIALVLLPICITKLIRTKAKLQKYHQNPEILTKEENHATFLEAGTQVLEILEESKPVHLSGHFLLPEVPNIDKIASKYPNLIVEYELRTERNTPIRRILGVGEKIEDVQYKSWENLSS